MRPFPGMDPYLERHWLDVHCSLVHLAKVAMQDQLPSSVVARNGVRLLAEPLVMELETEPLRQRFIEILDASTGGRVVTVVEFVSPTNKLPGHGKSLYQGKQQECVAGRVNLVEIDLTRQGERELLVSPWELPPEWRTEYMACVYRANWKQWGRKEVYRIPLRERLPAIAVPLRAGDHDIVLDLQALVDEAYRAGAYQRTIDYRQPCDPRLAAEDEAWARGLIEKGTR